jgi:hypothetical protein
LNSFEVSIENSAIQFSIQVSNEQPNGKHFFYFGVAVWEREAPPEELRLMVFFVYTNSSFET